MALPEEPEEDAEEAEDEEDDEDRPDRPERSPTEWPVSMPWVISLFQRLKTMPHEPQRYVALAPAVGTERRFAIAVGFGVAGCGYSLWRRNVPLMAVGQNQFLEASEPRHWRAMAENLFATGAFEIFNHAPKQEDLEKIHDHYAPVGEDALQLVISHILEVLKTKVSVKRGCTAKKTDAGRGARVRRVPRGTQEGAGLVRGWAGERSS